MTTKTTKTEKKTRSLTGDRKYSDLVRVLKQRLEDPALTFEQKTDALDRLQAIYLHLDKKTADKAERALRQAELEKRQTLAQQPVNRDLLIAQLQSEVEARKNGVA